MAEKTQAAPGAEIDAEGARELYRRMRLIRTFEDTVQQQFQKGNVHGTTHLYSGQEASGVGVCSMLRDGDKVAATYRGHGHSIAHGVAPQALMDEMFGRSTGACGGRAGSMNVVDQENGLIGCFGIVGGSIGAATGAALSEKLLGTGNVAVAFFGDGTSNQAYFSRVAELGAGGEAAGRLRLREQPLHGVHADRGRHRGRDRLAAAGARASTTSRSTATTSSRCARRRARRSSTPAPAPARPSWRR